MRHSKVHKARRNRFTRYSLGILLVLLMAVGSSTLAQGSLPKAKPAHSAPAVRLEQGGSPNDLTPPPTVVPSETPTEIPTEIPTETPTELPTEIPTLVETPTLEPTLIVSETPAPEVTPEPSPEVIIEPTQGDPSLDPALLGVQASCKIEDDIIKDPLDPYTFTFAASGNHIATYEWDFPMGVTVDRTGTPVTWDFEAPGTYTYTLTCITTPATGSLTLPVIQGSIVISDPITVNFSFSVVTNADLPSLTINAASTTTGTVVTYAWSLNTDAVDPSVSPIAIGSDDNFSHTFTLASPPPAAALYLHLTVTGNDAIPRLLTLPVGVRVLPPKVTFTMDPPSGTAPLAVLFAADASLGGPVASWSWNFGDGSPADTSGSSVSHTYTAPDIYTITLTYSNASGGGSVTKQVLVTSNSEQVSANISGYTFEGTNGSIVVCYTNASEGPFVVSDWDFGDGTPIVRANEPVVCHTYASGGNVTVTLNVCSALSGGGIPDSSVPCVQGYDGEQSEWEEEVELIASPIAQFSSVASVVWGTVVDFTNQSTGIITTYDWDFNGDGITDLHGNYNDGGWSPQDRAISQLGVNIIRLTIYGPGGMSYVEHAIEVTRREITCAISGSTSVLPTATQTVYTSQVGSLNFSGFNPPRTATYSWVLTKDGTQLTTSTDTNFTLNWLPAYGAGTFTLTLTVTTSDGALCTTSQIITRDYQPVVCYITSPSGFPSTLYADGITYTFTVDVRNLDGRSDIAYQWYVNDMLQSGQTGTTFAWANTNVEPGAVTPIKISYTVTVTNPDSTVLPPCREDLTFNLNPWPTQSAICADLAINGDFTPLPSPWDNPYTYTASLNPALIAGRTVTYAWTVINPPGETTTATNQPSVGVRWHAQPPGITPGSPQPSSISLTVTVTNPNSAVGANCLEQEDIEVTIEPLECRTPTGDLTPLVGETLNYSAVLHNLYARNITSITWTLTKVDGSNNPIAAPEVFTWPPNSASVTASQSGNSGSTQLLSRLFPVTGERFTLSYTMNVAADTANNIAAENCASQVVVIVVRAPGVIFECVGDLTGSTSIPNAGGPYNYSIEVDNGNILLLKYVYTLELIDSSGATLQSTILDTHTSSNDGLIGDNEWNFTFAQLSQWNAGRYRLTVTVSTNDPLLSPYSCSDSIIIVVGRLGVNYTYTIDPTGSQTWTANALPVGQRVCITNTTTPVPATTHVNYTWSVSPATNNTIPSGTNYNAENLPCFTFTAEGNYTVTLTGVNDSGTTVPGSTHSVIFRVYGLQSITINRTGQLVVSSSNTFTATGVNIDSYAWRFYRFNTTTGVYDQIATASGSSTTRSFTPAGQYRARVIGTGDLGNTEAQLDFQIMPANSIAARFSAVPNAGITPYEVCFTDLSVSNPTSINRWNWNFGDGGTSTDRNPCHTYLTPGTNNKYTVTLTVRNTANVQATATSIIRTYSVLESSVNFSYVDHGAGYICFTPQGIPTGVVVTGWNFGDGSTGAAVGTGGLGEVCHTYAVLGQTYTVVMYVEGPGGEEGEHANDVTPQPNPPQPPVLTVGAVCGTNRVATFTITNTGAAAVDSVTIRNTSAIPVQVVYISSHNFANGTVTPSVVTINVPNQSGTVTLSLTNYAGAVTIGSTLTTSCNYPPDIVVTASCVGNLPVFTITNQRAGDGPMTAAQHYTITDSLGNVIVDDTHSFLLNSLDPTQETLQITLPGQNPYLNYTFSMAGTVVIVHADVTSSCAAAQPSLSVATSCVGAFTFTITNNSAAGSMVLAQNYIIVNSANVTVASGSFQLAAGASQPITLPNTENPYAAGGYKIQSDDFAGTLDVDHNCAQPELTVSSTCAYPLTITITNSGTAGNMLLDQAYTIVDSGNNTVASGTLNLAAGASTAPIALTGLDPYASYTVLSNGFAGTLNATPTPCAQPELTVSSTCAYPLTITITNSGTAGNMLLDQAYTIVDSGNNTVASGTLNLAAGASTAPIALTGLDPYASYTVLSNGFAGTLNATPTPCASPSLSVSYTCAYPVTFTITNDASAGDMLTSQTYTVVDALNNTVASGSFQLAAGASTAPIELTGLDPYATYTLQSSGFAGALNVTPVPCTEIQLVAQTQCAEIVSFTLANTGIGNMLTSQDYTITDADGNPVTAYTVVDDNGDPVAPGSFQLDAGASITITLTDVNPYHEFTFSTSGFAGSAQVTHNCVAPVLNVTSTCTNPIGFIVTNDGGDMLTEHSYRLFYDQTQEVTPANNKFLLLSGESLKIDVPDGLDMVKGLTFVTDDLEITSQASFNCTQPGGYIAPTPSPEAASGAGRAGFRGIASGDLAEVDWNATCGRNCPPFRVYHTDETGSWNIFRLDGADAEAQETFRRNLTYGVGEGTEDMHPSLSPNNRWVVFASNRDGNWEIYVASTSGDPASVQRVTHNTIASDTNPVWGPNNIVVYQSTRNGNWDLYAIDMETGREYQLTDDPADDTNPTWSLDGTRILFQSDRPDENGARKWQVYEMTVGSFTTRRLSDGTGIDVDPQYSNNGTQIVFRSYNEADGNSVLMLMDANGGNRRAITTPEEDATNAAWSPFDRYIAYQSDRDGDLDIYVYEVATGLTRHLSGNGIPDYAPTWLCDEERVIFTSDINGTPDIYEVNVQPITGDPLPVERDADQLTFEPASNIYPLGSPLVEEASMEGQTSIGVFGEQTVFLRPDASITPDDNSTDALRREDWESLDGCEG